MSGFNKKRFLDSLKPYKKIDKSPPTEGFMYVFDIIMSPPYVKDIDFDKFTLDELYQATQHFHNVVVEDEEEFATQNAGEPFYETFRMYDVFNRFSVNPFKTYEADDDFI